MAETITVSKINEVFFKLDLSQAQSKELKEFLSCKAPNFMFHPMYKSGMWNGKLYFYNTQERTLPIGLLPKFIKFCDEFRYPFIFDFDRTKEFGTPVSEEFLDKFYEAIFPPECNIYPRDYQQEAILQALQNWRGILNLSTGAGKSILIYSLIRYMIAMKMKVILLVPNVSLVEQMFSDFTEYGWTDIQKHVTKLYSGQEYNDTDVLITTWQSVYKKDQRFFAKYQGILLDECHTIAGNSIQEICKKAVNAKIRIGLTGTLPPEEANKMTLFGYLGPVLYELKAKDLIDKDVLSQIKIKNLLMRYPETMRHARQGFQHEMGDINNYAQRNKTLDYILSKSKEGDNSLVLVHRIEHLKEVKEYLENNHKDKIIYDIYGDTLPARREEIRKKIEHQGNVVLVATYATLSTGINIKKLHNIIFFASYKSQIKILQSIGRGLRKHESKENMVLWDCVDDLRYRDGKKTIKNYCFKHWELRKEYYLEQEFEFSDDSFNI